LGTAAFELKFIKGTRALPFSAVKAHQIRGLKLAQKKLIYKISDADMVSQKPFDSFLMQFVPAFVVIMWWLPYKPKKFYLIPVDMFVKETKQSKRKSLTQQRASEIGREYII